MAHDRTRLLSLTISVLSSVAGRGALALAGACSTFASAGACSSETFHTATSTPDDGGADAAGRDAQSDAPVCGDTSNDSINCGRCGHTCLGGKCQSGRCAPVQLATTDQHPTAIVLDDQRFYAVLASASAGPLLECPLLGCASGSLTLNAPFAGAGIALDAQGIFLSEASARGDIHKALKNARSAPTATNGDNAVVLRVDGSSLFIANDGSGVAGPSINRFTGAINVLVTTPAGPVRGMLVLGNRLVWTVPSTRSVQTCLKNSAAPVVADDFLVASVSRSGPGASAIARVDNTLFIAGQVDKTVVFCDVGPSCATPRFFSTDGEATILASDGASNKLYWYEADNAAIRSCSPAQCLTKIDDVLLNVPKVSALAVDATAVYFTIDAPLPNGGVYRLAK